MEKAEQKLKPLWVREKTHRDLSIEKAKEGKTFDELIVSMLEEKKRLSE